jgi:hypothetical protein
MNYAKHYHLLIEKADSRNKELFDININDSKGITKKKAKIAGVYGENHHIIPSCINRDDSPENIVFLLAEEHFIAHQLLVKMYPNEYGLIDAANIMTVSNEFHDRRVNNKLFSWLKKKNAENSSRKFKGRKHTIETIQKMKLAQKGKIFTEETREKLRKANIGKKQNQETIKKRATSLKGRQVTQETRDKISKSEMGKVVTEETREKLRLINIGKSPSEEHRANISLALTGRVLEEEHKIKIGNSNRGKKRSPEIIQKMKEREFSEEHRKNMSIAKKGTTRPPETIEKIRISMIGKSPSEEARENMIKSAKNRKPVTCPHCGKEGDPGPMKRHHFDNCKNNQLIYPITSILLPFLESE